MKKSKITSEQYKMILLIEELVSERFTGKTEWEASQYIDKYENTIFDYIDSLSGSSLEGLE